MNPYQIHVNCDAKVGQFFQGLAYQSFQGVGTWVICELLKAHKEEAVKFLGQTAYESALKHYSKSLKNQLEEPKPEPRKSEPDEDSSMRKMSRKLR